MHPGGLQRSSILLGCRSSSEGGCPLRNRKPVFMCICELFWWKLLYWFPGAALTPWWLKRADWFSFSYGGSVQFSRSVMSNSETPWTTERQASLSITNSQTHVHQVSDAIQPSHPLSSHSPPAPNPSQHQGLFKWVSSSYQVAKVLEFQLQHQSFQWTPRTDLL